MVLRHMTMTVNDQSSPTPHPPRPQGPRAHPQFAAWRAPPPHVLPGEPVARLAPAEKLRSTAIAHHMDDDDIYTCSQLIHAYEVS